MKFRLAPRAATRAVRELALGTGRTVSSIYFDTPDRVLSHARTALRVRRDGAKWLQAFKSDMAPGARGEWEMPAAHGELDVRGMPCAQIRSATGIDLASLAPRLRPLFETRFVRRAALLHFADAAVEVALDRGHVLARGRREAIRELELELKSGAPAAMLRYAESLIEPLRLQLAFESKAQRGYRLAQRQRRAPPVKWRRPDLRGATPGDALARLAAAALEQVGANVHGVLESADPEYLHQLRVGLRRFRAMLRAFRALAPRTRPLKRGLRSFGGVLGAARDWDVFVQSLAAGASLRRAANKERARASAAARAVIASPAFQAWLVRALRWIEQAPWAAPKGPLGRFAARALERLQRKARKVGARIAWPDARERHALRIRVKRLRYACDAFEEYFPGGAAVAYLAALEALQDDFGELNDIAVARRLMERLPPDPATVRKLAARERQLISRVRRDWDAFAERRPFWRADT